jgi:hypothetical protein
MNQYGLGVGGPILKNKLFFFTDWKRRSAGNASRTVTVTNPDAIFDSAGNANLSAAIPAGTNCNVTRVAGCVFDPNTGNADGTGRLAFPGNIIPAARIDPAAKLMLGRIRKSGFLNNDGVTATNNYNTTGSATLDRDTNDIKVNYVPGGRFRCLAGTASRALNSLILPYSVTPWAVQLVVARSASRLPESRASDLEAHTRSRRRWSLTSMQDIRGKFWAPSTRLTSTSETLGSIPFIFRGPTATHV